MQIVKLKQLELALAVAKNEKKWKLDVIGRAQQPIIRNQNFATVPKESVCYTQQSLDVAKKKFFYGCTTTFEITTLREIFYHRR